jgi:ATP-binding cassette subfamily B multidrug efflux pump
MTSRIQRRLQKETVIPPQSPLALSRGLCTQIFIMRPHVRALIIGLALASALLGILGPYCQKLFVDAILREAQGQLPIGYLMGWISLAFGALLLSQTFAIGCKLVCSREGALLNRWLSRSLYAHALKLSQSSRRSRPTGEFVNIFAQDVAAVTMMVDELLPIAVMSLIPFFAAPLAVWLYFSVPVLPLLSVSLASLLLLFGMAYRQARFFTAFKRLASDRLAVVNEWLQNIRILRILGWTEFFEEKIFQKRRLETVNRLAMVTNGSGMSAFSQVAPGMISITGIATVVFTKATVTPGEIFALLWVLSVFLSRPIRSLPFNLVMLLDGLTSCKRLEEIFRLPTEDYAFTDGKGMAVASEHALEVRGLTLELEGKTLLDGIDLHLKRGEFVAIVGEVGAGKSLLLDSLLREAPAKFESYFIGGQDALQWSLDILRGHFAYVPQEGFIMSASLRDNIAFSYGAQVDDRGLLESLDLSAFAFDQASLKDGLNTEIGERGVNLSGGQRQRVNIARAHYSQRELLLLDDCLSAVDVDTEKRLLDRLLKGAWSTKTRLLVTHRLSILPFVDRVLVMRDGAIVLDGRYEDLMEASKEFRELTKTLHEMQSPSQTESRPVNE